ncbi:hypothetical protein [Nocardia sp. NPDC003963]
MAGISLDVTITQVLHRIGGSIDDVATVLHRDTDTFTGKLRGGTDTLVHRDEPTALGRLASQDYDGRILGRWNQPPVPRVDNAPEMIADELERIYRSGDKARWANYDPRLYRKGYRGFENWLKSDEPLGPLHEGYGLNCWEMVCYAAARSGVADKRYLRELTEFPRAGGWNEDFVTKIWQPRMAGWLIPEGRRLYTGAPGSPRPQRGDIVMWNQYAEHVTVATGRTGKDGSPELYSSWYLPKYQAKYDELTDSYSQVVDAVQVTTVKELSDGMHAIRNNKGKTVYPDPFEIYYGRGPW